MDNNSKLSKRTFSLYDYNNNNNNNNNNKNFVGEITGRLNNNRMNSDIEIGLGSGMGMGMGMPMRNDMIMKNKKLTVENNRLFNENMNMGMDVGLIDFDFNNINIDSKILNLINDMIDHRNKKLFISKNRFVYSSIQIIVLYLFIDIYSQSKKYGSILKSDGKTIENIYGIMDKFNIQTRLDIYSNKNIRGINFYNGKINFIKSNENYVDMILYYDIIWDNSKFDVYNTKINFKGRTIDGLTFVNYPFNLEYYEDDEYKSIRIPLQNKGGIFTIVIPKNDNDFNNIIDVYENMNYGTMPIKKLIIPCFFHKTSLPNRITGFNEMTGINFERNYIPMICSDNNLDMSNINVITMIKCRTKRSRNQGIKGMNYTNGIEFIASKPFYYCLEVDGLKIISGVYDK